MKNYFRSVFALVAGLTVFLAVMVRPAQAQGIRVMIQNFTTPNERIDLPSGIVDRPAYVSQYLKNGGLNQKWILTGCRPAHSYLINGVMQSALRLAERKALR